MYGAGAGLLKIVAGTFPSYLIFTFFSLFLLLLFLFTFLQFLQFFTTFNLLFSKFPISYHCYIQKVLYTWQTCVMHLKKNYFCLLASIIS